MRPRARAAAGALSGVLSLTGLLLAGLTGCAPSTPRPDPDETIKAATHLLTVACLARQGLTPPRPGQSPQPADRQQRVTDALFGTGPAELSVTLPTGYAVHAHTNGCLAEAQQRLYGDQRRWFRASVIVNNFGPEADHTHSSLSEVRARHRAEIDDWKRLRAHALTEATTVFDNPPSKGASRS
ncbi:hypothetical protein CTZ27_10430 [Streptomyces griseocarneus]|nr:hypothetical protein CTZ27_10430 [Streptomyces griseocarneus]